MKERLLDNLKQSLPELVSRKEAEKRTGGLVKARTLANKDSLGEGPAQRVKLGRLVAYPRDSFVEWLGRQLEVDNA